MKSDFYDAIKVRGILNNDGKTQQEKIGNRFCNLNDFTGYVNACMQR